MNLVLFFTLGKSLQQWIKTGLIDREKLIYEEHLNQGQISKVYWITYGVNDKIYEQQLKDTGRLHNDIIIIPMPKLFRTIIGYIIYSFIIPFYHRKVFISSDIIKTNQINGSWSAVISKLVYKTPLIIRTGYTRTQQFQYCFNNSNSIKKKFFELIEFTAYKICDIGIVASFHNKKYLENKYKLDATKIKVVYNNIDTKIFSPNDCIKYKYKVIFVGRLSKAKNLFNLIKAISRTNLTLDIYGDGYLKNELKEYVKKINAKVLFKGVVANNKFPSILNKYEYFILPSYYEGMPKSLLEAMACGLVCIGTNVVGINEVINDNINGYLINGTDSQDIERILIKVIKSDNTHIKKNAIEIIKSTFALAKIVDEEKEIFDKIIKM
jgi:glycosyltransferase involved in cell wall biosynthesis